MIDTVILDAFNDIAESHTGFCMFLLTDARQGRAAARRALPNLRDAVDPFAAMKPIQGVMILVVV